MRGVRYITLLYPFFAVIYLKLVHSTTKTKQAKKEKRFAHQNTNFRFAGQVFEQLD
jgi:hypothetical protein